MPPAHCYSDLAQYTHSNLFVGMTTHSMCVIIIIVCNILPKTIHIIKFKGTVIDTITSTCMCHQSIASNLPAGSPAVALTLGSYACIYNLVLMRALIGTLYNCRRGTQGGSVIADTHAPIGLLQFVAEFSLSLSIYIYRTLLSILVRTLFWQCNQNGD